MEKLKITREQEKAIEWYRENFTNEGAIQDFIRDRHPALSEFTTEQFALLFLEWYEVEPEFKLNDYVWHTENDTILKLDDEDRVEFANKYYTEKDKLRHATPEEIQQEKERRWWAKHGRGVWELREGDILLEEGETRFSLVVTRGNRTEDGLNRTPSLGYRFAEMNYIKNNYKVVCFAEDRKDVKNND